MFASMLSELSEWAANVTALVDARMLTLFRNSFSNVTFIEFGDRFNVNPNEFDVVLPFGNLPSIFRRELKDFNYRRYLYPTKAKIEHYKNSLNSSFPNKQYIGISWQGGVPTTRLKHRSMALEQLAPIFEIPNCIFVNLQYGKSAGEADHYNQQNGTDIISFPKAETNDLDNLAALIDSLDFVVTVQNTNVHLCGALNKKCLAILPSSPEWRYGIEGEKMPWYESVTLFRQSVQGTWVDAVERVKISVTEQLNITKQGN